MVHNNLLAQKPYVMPTLNGLGIEPTTEPGKILEKVVSNIIGILTIVGIIYFILQIIFAGYSMLSSSGDPKKIESSRDRLTQGVLGLFVVMIAIVIGSLIAALAGIQNPLNVNEILTNLKFN